MRRSSWPRRWTSCGGQVSPGGRRGKSARGGGGANRGEAERRGGDPERGTGRPCLATAARQCCGAASRGGEGRPRLRPSADCGGRSESAGSASPRRQRRICGRARAGRCRRPGRPWLRIPSAPLPALRSPAEPRPPRTRGLAAGGGKGFLSSSQPRQDRSYLAP